MKRIRRDLSSYFKALIIGIVFGILTNGLIKNFLNQIKSNIYSDLNAEIIKIYDYLVNNFGYSFMLCELLIIVLILLKYIDMVCMRSNIFRIGFVEKSIIFVSSVFLVIQFFNTNYKRDMLLLIFVLVALLIFIFIPIRKILNIRIRYFSMFNKFKELIKKTCNNLFNVEVEENNENRCIDKPIKSSEDLKLIDAGTDVFQGLFSKISMLVKKLTEDKEIDKHIEDSSYSICVDAGWGVGKTSFVNLVKDEIFLRRKKDKEEILWIDYDPWSFSDLSELVRDFFQTLADNIKEKYGFVINDGDYRKYVNLLTPVLENSVNRYGLGTAIGGLLKLLCGDKKTLIKLKEKVKDNLSIVPGKIVIVLDDIDRMGPEEIMMVVKLIKLTASFPKILFIVPFDYERVSAVIVEEFGQQYRDYLDKIVNEEIEIKSYSYRQFKRIFDYHLNVKLENEEETREKYNLYLINEFREKILDLRIKRDAMDLSKSGMIDPYRIVFNDLFRLFCPYDHIDDLWMNRYGDKAQVYQVELLSIFNEVIDGKLNNINELCRRFYVYLRAWEQYRFIEKYAVEIINKLLVPAKISVNDQIVQNISTELNDIRNKAMEVRARNYFIPSNYFFRLKRIFDNYKYVDGTMDKDERRKFIKMVKDFKAITDKYGYEGEHYKNYSGKFYDDENGGKIIILDWLVSNSITPRDVVKYTSKIKAVDF